MGDDECGGDGWMHHKPWLKTTLDYTETKGSKPRSQLEHRMLLKSEMLPQNSSTSHRSPA